MHRFARDTEFDSADLEQLRTRLAKMSDADLLEFGEAAKYMCSPDAYFGQSPRQAFVIQLEEARAEYRRRQAKTH